MFAGDVTLGDGANIWCGVCIRGDLAPVVIGRNSNVQDNATIHVGYGVPAILGDNVTVGHNAVVHGATVGNGVLIGMGSVILDGAKIGDGCIIGAATLIPEARRSRPAASFSGIRIASCGRPRRRDRQGVLQTLRHTCASRRRLRQKTTKRAIERQKNCLVCVPAREPDRVGG